MAIKNQYRSEKKIFYTLVGLILVVFLGALIYVNTNVPFSTSVSKPIMLGSHSILSGTSSEVTSATTSNDNYTSNSSTETNPTMYIFAGALLEKVGNEMMDGQPAQQFYVDVDTRKIFPDQSGNVRGEITISTKNLSLQGGSTNTSETFKFYATYNPTKHWYEITQMQPYNADF